MSRSVLRVLVTLLAAAGVASAPDATACSYCAVGVVCCGDVGQPSCAGFAGPGCNYACKDGLHYGANGVCESDCSYCTTPGGTCCGDEGQVTCAGVGQEEGCNFECRPGYSIRGGTCQPPCSYCENARICCGDEGQISCAGGGGRNGERCPTSTCKSGTCFNSNTGVCAACESRDDGFYFTLGACGQSYERYCALDPSCDDGYFRDDGYVGYVGTATCQPEWQAPAASPPATGFDFTFFVATDVHIGEPERSECYPDSAYDDMTRMINDVGHSGLAWPTGFARAGQPIGDPLAVVLTGDLTVHGSDSPEGSHVQEFTRFRDYWDERRTDDDDTPSVDFPVYPGLGNHDVIDVCALFTDDPFCTRKTSKNDISLGYIDARMKHRSGIDFDDESRNYSWDWGPVHFVQGHLWPGHFEGGLDWLRTDLATNVGTSGRPVVIFQHYGWHGGSLARTCQPPDPNWIAGSSSGKGCTTDADCTGLETCLAAWWSDDDRTSLEDVLAGYNVVGVFAGHTHAANHHAAKHCEIGRAACTSDADCVRGSCVAADPPFDVFTGEDGGQDDDCDADQAAGRTPQGDGGFFAVRFADAGGGLATMEVLQLLWAAPIDSASAMTWIDAGTPGMPSVSKTIRLKAQPPVARCRDLRLAADDTCHASGSVDDGSYDPDGPPPTCVASPAAPWGAGTTGVTLACTDAQGLDASCQASVTVRDESAPSIDCTAASTVECTDGNRGGRADVHVSATDNCTASPAAQCRAPAGGTFPLGTTPVHCSATDLAGNAAACDTSVSVVDGTRPRLTCPAPSTVECTGSRRARATWQASATDACWGTLSPVCTPASGTSFALGTTPLTCAASDGSGNRGTCTSSVRVVDTRRPVVTCSAGIPQPTNLWPPDHELVDVRLTASVGDTCDGVVPLRLRVYSNEDDQTATAPSERRYSPDAKDIAPGTLRLRRERAECGEGRLYLVVAQATDSSGNTGAGCCAVGVPHDQTAASLQAMRVAAADAVATCEASGGLLSDDWVPVGDQPVVAAKQYSRACAGLPRSGGVR